MNCTVAKLRKYIKTEPQILAAAVILCNDGLEMSVQAGTYNYCEPRENEPVWTSVEIGFPNRIIEEFLEYMYADTNSNPTECVYGYVPIELVVHIINKSGGICPSRLI